MDRIMKKFITVFLSVLLLNFVVKANNYILFYWQWCPHCAKVESFIQKNNIKWIQEKEVWFNQKSRKEFMQKLSNLWVDISQVWVPFLVVETDTGSFYKMWDEPIIDLLKEKFLQWKNQSITDNLKKTSWQQKNKYIVDNSKINPKFLLILIPAAFSDSINPCAFAVILILLSSIFLLHNNRKKVVLAWLAFSASVFISYFSMWIWLYKALATVNNTLYLKLFVWILWIVIWLANLKDVFWYGKVFVMEVPFSWRKNLRKLIQKATSPLGAFVVGFGVSLFLLPCTSWPYITVLWYLSSENSYINFMGYIYLIVYNLIFILPMLIITFLVAYNFAWAEKLTNMKEEKNRLIHLIVGLLMIGLWVYVIWDII